METRVLLAAVMTLTALGAALAIKSFTPDTLPVAAPQPVMISIDGLHRQVDVRSLPELEIRTPIEATGCRAPASAQGE